ncbi:MAG: TRAP transporter large permease subunit [Gammaproteobacteria bacterium]|nr:TRAP transporter large permease subunit [Gammaproteobacteria bacterium]MYF53025.1 TRAP transporter large permease subunit [Gammaproteobacteria bacterium]MYK44304.1 TRAP transporter large permease subunit [Gammaproteobacteria bacterium]
MIYLGLVGVLIMALLGAPLFAVILALTMVVYLATDISLVGIATEILRIANTPLLVALPLFTFCGYLLAESNASQRMMNLLRALLGWMPSGIAIVGFVACALFTALTGASGVTIVALGAVLFPILMKSGYSEKFSLGLVTTSGSLGLLIVPSVPLILYGVVAQQTSAEVTFTIQELFLAGLVPTFLMILALSTWSLIKHRNLPTTKFDGSALWKSICECKWELPLPIFVLIGIYTGVITISEVAAIAALWVLIVEVFIHKEISFRKLPTVIQESMVMVGCIILILGCALALTNFFVHEQIAEQLFAHINKTISNPIVFLLLLNLFLLLLGAVLDVFSAIVIMVPLLVPIAMGYGIHPVHLGVIFMANLQIGYFTPPVGMNLFISSYRFKKSILDLYGASFPFMVVLLAVLLAVTFVPFFSTWYQHL